MNNQFIDFNIGIGRQKPESIIHTDTACPFCSRNDLTGIIAEDGDIILLRNKYQVLADSLQTVLIETADCNSELSEYTTEHLHRLFKFGISHWLEMIRSGEYASVIFFKNHGPLSGGTIRHPHMQIIGLYHNDVYHDIDQRDFTGLVIDSCNNVELNLSTWPRIGFAEFNVKINGPAATAQIDQLADYARTAVHYLLNRTPCTSYNLFFYFIDDSIHLKIMPRYPTSPLFIGYNLHLVSSNTADMVSQVQALYFNK